MGIPSYQIFDGLNEFQEKAVKTIDRPLLVVAGPGTGKTRTIVRRIVYLIQQGALPEDILAVTFTNRAAREMRERAAALLGNVAGKVFIGTFHALGLRIIRDCRGDDFSIYSRDEQIELLKSLMKNSTKKAQRAVEGISRIKNFLEDADSEVQEAYESYQAALNLRNAFDLDDLIKIPIAILQNSETALKYQNRFRYIIVDEYQDINPAQYVLLRLLAGSSGNVCVVGDADQAIYAFRGADLENFLNFEKDFPGAAWITLTENYRSLGIILNAADSLIKNNQKRIEKELIPTREEGRRVSVTSVPDERAEGTAIIEEIEKRLGGTSHFQMTRNSLSRDDPESSFRFSDFAVVFRTNAQAKALEEAFAASGIPYQIVGRRKSAQRKEIEETVTYLQSLIHPDIDAQPDLTDVKEAKLLSAADFFDPRADAVTLMTLHMAKGLEFPIVFITGCDDGLIPCTLMKADVDIEEERRLFYVGMTRAKNELFLISARSRFLYGQRLDPSPTPFLREIPEKYIQVSVMPDRDKKQKEKDSQLRLF
ncbi:MAG TPA: UvrD-helicase domain-containing protein [Nitrospirota bacterium]|nr:UvrD-helicase domain-containing protein [Nitrospirota bacterium]